MSYEGGNYTPACHRRAALSEGYISGDLRHPRHTQELISKQERSSSLVAFSQALALSKKGGNYV